MHGHALKLVRRFATADPSRDVLQGILGSFRAPVSYCFGYGSGVFSQGLNQRKKDTQIDLILAVENSVDWHRQNIEQYPHHYSGLRHLGPSVISTVQRNIGAGVYFNPFCNIMGLQVKYGVVELEDLRRDLENWDTLYLAGRMHKPVQVLQDNAHVSASQRENLLAAMAVALLLLPAEFSERELYMKIAGVSYMGDVRMALAENPNKVRNIVDNQFSSFRQIYSPLLSWFPVEFSSSTISQEHLGPLAKGASFVQDFAPESRENLLEFLPKKFRARIGGDPDDKIRTRVSTAVLSTIKKPSFTQSLKGLLTAGISRSASYSYEKLKKRWSK